VTDSSSAGENDIKYIYLDTCHLQNLKDKGVYQCIFEKLCERKMRLVLSVYNLLEMLQREDKRKFIEVCNNLDRFDVVYLRENAQLLEYDIKKYAKMKTTSPFSNDMRNLIHGLKNPELYLLLKVFSSSHYKLFSLLYEHDNKQKIISEEKLVKYTNDNQCFFENKDKRKKAIFDSAETKFNQALFLSGISPELIKKTDGARYSPSFLIPFVVQLYKSQNSQRKLKSSALIDAAHCTAIPHVDYFLTDKGNKDNAKKALDIIIRENRKFYSGSTFAIIASKPSELNGCIENI